MNLARPCAPPRHRRPPGASPDRFPSLLALMLALLPALMLALMLALGAGLPGRAAAQPAPGAAPSPGSGGGPGEASADEAGVDLAALYVVRDVAVDVTAADAAAARDRAIDGARRQAFATLFARLVPERARAAPPELAPGALDSLIAGFEITSEKRSDVRYIGRLDVRFQPAAVRDWLLAREIPFAPRPAPAAVLVPVWIEAGRPVLWDSPNPWREAFERAALDDPMLPLIRPAGDLRDIRAVAAREALAGRSAALARLARRYGARVTVVARARWQQPGAPESGLEIRARRRARDGRPSEFALTLAARPGEDAEALLDRGAARLAAALAERWKMRTAIDPGMAPRRIEVTAPLDGLESWIEIRRRLHRIPRLAGIELRYLSTEAAWLALDLRGGEDRLARAFAQAGLELGAAPTAIEAFTIGRAGDESGGTAPAQDASTGEAAPSPYDSGPPARELRLLGAGR